MNPQLCVYPFAEVTRFMTTRTTTRRWMDNRLPRLGRRWFLGGAGAAVALPFLEVSLDGVPQAHAAGEKRLLLFHTPAGCNMSAWAPSGTGANFSFGETQMPVEEAGLKPRAVMITGADGIGGPRGHTCGISGVLTGVGCRENSATNALSMDQVAAQAFAGQTRFPSIQLGTNANMENPNPEAGYSPVLKANLSWSDANTPLPLETEPLRAFNRLFEGVTAADSPTPDTATTDRLQAKDALNASILDYVRTESEALSARLGAADRAKLDQYLTGVRELERLVQHVPTEPPDSAACAPGTAPQSGKPNDIQEHVKLMLDINAMAIICGLTRVSLFDYEHTTTERSHSFLGVNVGYHSSVTHHAGNPAALQNYMLVNRWLVSQFVYLAQKLDAVSEGTGTVLDNSVMMLFSELSDGDSHSSANLPILLLGSAGGAIQTGQLVQGQGGFGSTPVESVHLALLQAIGVDVQTFGRATSPIGGLRI